MQKINSEKNVEFCGQSSRLVDLDLSLVFCSLSAAWI